MTIVTCNYILPIESTIHCDIYRRSCNGELISSMSNFEHDFYATLIQNNFKFLKRDLIIDIEKLIQIATGCNAIVSSDATRIRTTHQTLKMSKFWKQVIKNGEENCKLVILKLIGENVISMEQLQKSQENSSSMFEGKISKDTLKQHRDKIALEMDLSRGVADMLFESRIITINDHDEIDDIEKRLDKRVKLLEILLRKSTTDWVNRFMFILHETDHEYLVDLLMTKNSRREYLDDGFTSTRIAPRTVAIHLEGREHDSRCFTGVQQDMGVIESTLQQAVDGKIVEIREGSIVIFYQTKDPNKLKSTLNEEEKIFLDRILQSSKNLVEYFGGKGIEKMWFEEAEGQTAQEKDCADCYRQTIHENYTLISDELEDDIMNETMEKLMENEDDKSIRDIMKLKTRSKKAGRFLKFVLRDYEDDNAILVFKCIFEKKSQLKINQIPCSCVFEQETNSLSMMPTKTDLNSNSADADEQDRDDCKACRRRPSSDNSALKKTQDKFKPYSRSASLPVEYV